jgi:protease-4
MLDMSGGVVEQVPEQDPFALAGGQLRSTPRRPFATSSPAHSSAPRPTTASRPSPSNLDGLPPARPSSPTSVTRSRCEAQRKPVLAYATGYGDDAYQLAAHGRDLAQPDGSSSSLAGPGGNNLYFAGLLEKLGVTANVYTVGTYKSAVEPFTRSDMSPEARENAQALAGTPARKLARRHPQGAPCREHRRRADSARRTGPRRSRGLRRRRHCRETGRQGRRQARIRNPAG